jgi:hypothetical protein
MTAPKPPGDPTEPKLVRLLRPHLTDLDMHDRLQRALSALPEALQHPTLVTLLQTSLAEDEINPPQPESDQPYFSTWVTQQLVDKYGSGVVFGGTIAGGADSDTLTAVDGSNTWVVTGTKGMFAYPAGEETIEAGTGSLNRAAEMVLERLLRMISRS